jgi:curli biogenesis system outer membrane secretion channel CsgG
LIKQARFIVLLPLLVLLSITSSTGAQARKRIAVMPFDDHTAATSNMNIGTKVADELIAKLSATGAFEIVDREYLNRIQAEQNLKLDSRFDATGAAKLGKLANVDVLIVGQINAFNANISTSKEDSFIATKTKATGVIELKVTARLLSVETGTILSAPTATSDQDKVLSESSSSLLVQGVGKSNASGAEAGLRKLVDKSVDDVAQQLATALASSASSAPRALSGSAPKVAGIADGLVVLNKGTKEGIKVGEKFSVTRVVDSGLKDPDTGKPMTRRKKLCTLTVSDADEGMASGKCEGDAPQAGDEAAVVAQ